MLANQHPNVVVPDATSSLGFTVVKGEPDLAGAIAVGIATVLAGLFLVAVSRVMALLAEYTAAKSGYGSMP